MLRWRKQKREGLLEPSEGKETRVALSRAERAAFSHLKSENATLQARLALAESTVDVLGKASALLESLAKSARPQPIQMIADPPAWGQRYERPSRT
jgi:transposase-like protein